MEIIWKDVTSYRRGDKERIPTILEAMICGFRICVHWHIYYQNTWLLSCHSLKIDNQDLKADCFDEATRKAINILITHLERYVELQKTLKEALKGQQGS